MAEELFTDIINNLGKKIKGDKPGSFFIDPVVDPDGSPRIIGGYGAEDRAAYIEKGKDGVKGTIAYGNEDTNKKFRITSDGKNTKGEIVFKFAGGGLAEEYYGKDKLDWMKNYSDQMTFEEYLRYKRSGSFADGGSTNGSGDAAFSAKVKELMDDGYDFGEAVREAMRQGYVKGGPVKITQGTHKGEWAVRGRTTRYFPKKTLAQAYIDGLPGKGSKGIKKDPNVVARTKETKTRAGYDKYIKLVEKYRGKRKDVVKITYAQWKLLNNGQRVYLKEKALGKLEPGAYKGEYGDMTQEQITEKNKKSRERYNRKDEAGAKRRAKALRDATNYYYEKGGSKGTYKADMKKTKGKATLAKDNNRLLKYMEIAAHKYKNPQFKQILDSKGSFVGVKDLSHKIDGEYKTYVPFEQYKTKYKNKKNYLPITDHRDYNNFKTFFNAAKKFKVESPDKLLGSYFQKYNRVPKYSEIYNFMKRDPRFKKYSQNSLEIHHRNLIENSPTRNLQLALYDRNTKTTQILDAYKEKRINLKQADQALKKLGMRVKVGNRMLGIPSEDPDKTLKKAKKETVKLFKEKVRTTPTVVEDMAKALKLELKVVNDYAKSKGFKLNSFAGFMDFADAGIELPPAVRQAASKILNVSGKVLRGLGKGAVVLDPMFAAYDFSTAIDKGVGGKEAGKYMVKKFGQDVLNLPNTLAGAVKFGSDFLKGKRGDDLELETDTFYKDRTFATDALNEAVENTPHATRLRNIANRDFDVGIGANMSMVDVMETPASRAEMEKARQKYLKGQLGPYYKYGIESMVEEEPEEKPLQPQGLYGIKFDSQV